jgi:hypothetical protein
LSPPPIAQNIAFTAAEAATFTTSKPSSVHGVALKTTQTAQGTFVTSFRRASADGVRALVKRGEVVYGRWEERDVGAQIGILPPRGRRSAPWAI